MPARGPSRRFFDAWSLVYDAPWVQWATYRPVHDAALRVLESLAPRHVLDLGCGTGLFTCRMRSELGSTHVVGLDFSSGMLRRASARDVKGAWVRGSALSLPLRTSTFDAVVCTEAFHWFPDQAAALAEIHRVLAPGGRLLVAGIQPRLESTSSALRLSSRLAGQRMRSPTRTRMRRMLEDAGFQVRTQRPVYRFPGGLLLPPVLTVAEA